MSATETRFCEHCGASSTAYWHKITPGLVGALIKFKRACDSRRTYSLHNRKDLDGTPYELNKNEAANWTGLRFHGLVAKDKEAGAGHWILTARGNAFLKGQTAIPARVLTQNNRVVGHDDIYVTVDDVFGTLPYFETIDTIERTTVDAGTQLSLVEVA
jgi:hypothetical protein